MEIRQPPLFIVGTGRSGTTVLARLLGLHPAIYAIKWESQFLVAPGGLLDLFFETKDEPWRRAEAFIGQLCGHWFERTTRPGTPQEYKVGLRENFDKASILVTAAVVRQAARLGDISLGSARFWANRAMHELLAARIGPEHSYWLEKTPASLIHMDRLKHVFPEARFIHIVRDGRDVIASMLETGIKPIASHKRYPATRAWAGELSFEKAAIYYRDVIGIGRELMEKLPPDSCLELRLEDLSRNKEQELSRIGEFTGLEITPEMLAFDLSKAHAGRAQKFFSGEQIRHIEQVAGDALRAYGYF